MIWAIAGFDDEDTRQIVSMAALARSISAQSHNRARVFRIVQAIWPWRVVELLDE